MHLCKSYSIFRYKYSSIFVTTNNMYYHFAVNRDLYNSMKFRFVLRPVTPKFVVSSSLSSLLTSANVVVAASAATSGTVHGAVTSAITQVAVTAIAIASGACLSTKVDFLWPKAEKQPGSLVLDGVDVTGYSIFNDAKVQKAIAFARKAHHGQLRKTGDPYLTHCICTGKILAVLVPSSGKRAVDTVVAGILHDVVDDTCESLSSVEREFGDDVTKLVAGVSRLSYINQYLRRCRRTNVSQSTISDEEANNLRVMLLGMVDDPRVVLIKLADRLHNMRTIYALPLPKAQAVAQETLAVWCSLASRLGLWALKAEMEDLCFAVLQPHMFCQMRAVLASMWNPYNKTKGSLGSSSIGHDSNIENETGVKVDEDTLSMEDLLQAVLPFDLFLDRRRRRDFLHNHQTCLVPQTKPKVVRDAGIALASLVACEEALERELFISTSYVPGMEVTLSSRLKSLYSIYSKMKRKEVGINKVYDARALRVIIGDKDGTLHGQAVRSCYSLLNIVHRLWIPIDGEFDDYIINPKPSGYQVINTSLLETPFSIPLKWAYKGLVMKQSLHTAVQGPDNSPLEVQIRTQRMHECAEHGLAAHWLYKEADNNMVTINGVDGSERTESSYLSMDLEEQSTIREDIFIKYSTLKEGHPVLRVEGSHLLAAVIVSLDEGGKQLLVAVSFGLEASEAVADRRLSYQIKRWEAYARLYKKVSEEWWCESGHGDLCTCLERYTLCRDGMYHKQDQFQRLLPTFIQIIDLTEHEEAEYRSVVSAVLEGKQIEPSSNCFYRKPSSNLDTGISIKVRLLRTMLQWEEQLRYKSGGKQDRNVPLGEVAIICWPNGEIMRLKSGSTAADVARRVGHEGKLVSVNGQLVLHNTELKDGDIVEVRV